MDRYLDVLFAIILTLMTILVATAVGLFVWLALWGITGHVHA